MPDFEDQYRRLEDEISQVMATGVPDLFGELALKAYRFQREFNHPYRRYCEQLGVEPEIAEWRRIPPVPQSAFKAFSLRAFPAEGAVAAFHTSGTTGEGYGIHEFCSLRLYDEAILHGWDRLGVPALPQLILAATPDTAPHSSLSYMMGQLAQRAPAGEQHWLLRQNGTLDAVALAQRVEEFRRRQQPVIVLGTALAFLHWCEEGPEAALPEGSLAFETGGYKGSGRTLNKEDLYARMTRHLGLLPTAIINEYGMTELSSQCYTRGLGQPHEAPPWMRVLAVDPATGQKVPEGETGVLRIYDLANLGSVIGLQTRDLAIRRAGGFELLGRDPAALPRGCSRPADELMNTAAP